MNDPLTTDELALIKARCELATTGPWFRDAERDSTIFSANDGMIGGVLYNTKGGADADFIAAARTDIPRLVATVEHLQRELATSKDDVKCATSGPPVDYIELNMSNYNDYEASQLNEWAIWANTEIERLQREVATARRHYYDLQHDVQQTLGKALGYRNIYVKDGVGVVSPDTPGAVMTDDVCVGEHVAETLAMEAAAKLAAAKGL